MAKVDDYITVSDFSKGIVSDDNYDNSRRIYEQISDVGSTTTLQSVVSHGQVGFSDGAANPASTFGCYADATGALAPLPRRIEVAGAPADWIEDLDDHPLSGVGYYPPNQSFVNILDMIVVGPLFNAGSEYQVFFLVQVVRSPDGDADFHQYVMLFSANGTPSDIGLPITTPLVIARSVADTADEQEDQGILSGSLAFILTLDGTPAVNPLPYPVLVYSVARHWNNFEVFGTATDAADPAVWETTDNNYMGSALGLSGFLSHPSTGADYDFAKETGAGDEDTLRHLGYMITHQGRIVGVSIPYASQLNGGDVDSSEILFYSQVGNLTTISDELPATNPGEFRWDYLIPDEGYPVGYGAMFSMNVQELLLIKHEGGGILVRGDLNNPTIQRMPFIKSTGGVVSKPVGTPLGLVYLTDTGVYAWQGDNTSLHLSPQLGKRFWDYRLADVDTRDAYWPQYGTHARLAFNNHFVFLPNGWILDTRNQAWWRLEDDEPGYAFYSVFPGTSSVYAMPARWGYDLTQLMAETTGPATYDFTTDFGRQSYTWESQPLLKTIDRTYNFTEFELIVQDLSEHEIADVRSITPTGAQVVATLTGYDDDGNTLTPAVITIDLDDYNDSTIKKFRRDIPGNFIGRHVVVKLEVSGASYQYTDAGDTFAYQNPAPRILGFRIGVAERQETHK